MAPNPPQIPVTECDVRDYIILSSASKSCDLDPVKTDMLKQCMDVMLTPLTRAMNDWL